MRHDPATLLLFCCVDQQALDLIAATGWVALPLRPARAMSFVMRESEAAQLAYGVGYVLRFAVDADYAAQFPVQNVGSQEHEELWVPAEELAEFNRHIVGQIEVVGVFNA